VVQSSYTGKSLRNPFTGKEIEYTGLIPVPDNVADFVVTQIKELIDMYDLDYFSIGGAWEHSADYWHTKVLLAYYYNKAEAENRRRGVLVNNYLGNDTAYHGDFCVFENMVPGEIFERP